MKLYELAYLLSPSISPEEAQAFPQKLATLIESKKGSLDSQTPPHRRPLAYPIRKRGNTYTSCYFGTMRFYLEPEVLPDFSEDMRSQEQIIRFLLFAAKPKRTPDHVLAPRKRKAPVLPHKPKLPKVELEKLEEKLEELLGT